MHRWALRLLTKQLSTGLMDLQAAARCNTAGM